VVSRASAFTLLELLIVVVILGILGAAALPAMMSNQDGQCNAAARVVVADLELAQSTAVAQQASVAVVFSVTNQSYKVVLVGAQNLNNYAGLVAMGHPEKPGQPYQVSLANDVGASRVTFSAPVFGTHPYVVFDTFGGTTTSGSVVVRAGDASRTVQVGAVTGAVSVQ
jgi:prepilin-type N-terminal cleavage/methylation domain-containing protein